MADNNDFRFRVSFSILNHLGPGLYRSFATVIAEAISNAWDADAKCVNIKIESGTLTIWDDGIGMSRKDIEDKFLNIGYTRRKKSNHSKKDRHVLGRKGIGKLAYLSISDELIIITKKKNEETIPVRMDNSKLREAINEDEEEYILVSDNADIRDNRISESGTQLIFRKLEKDLIIEDIRQILATQFHFAHALKKRDKFEIRVNNKPIGMKDLKKLYKETEFIWFLNEASKKEFMAQIRKDDVRVKFMEQKILDRSFEFNGVKKEIRGYIASVGLPSQLKLARSDEKFKASVSLFAGGRIRESEIISKIPTAKIPENYLFGQIHIDEMDSEDVDRFTTSREGVIENDPLYQQFLDFMKKEVVPQIIKDWNKWRKEKKKKEKKKNPPSINKKVEALLKDLIRENIDVPENHPLIQEIIKLADINVPSYVRCFVAENLMRIYISKKRIPKTNKIKREISNFKKQEKIAKEQGNVAIDIRRKLLDEEYNDLSYLDSLDLAAMIDKGDKGDKRDRPDSLKQDAKGQRPIRNALMHTATLSEEAKKKGDASWNNIINKITKFIEE